MKHCQGCGEWKKGVTEAPDGRMLCPRCRTRRGSGDERQDYLSALLRLGRRRQPGRSSRRSYGRYRDL